MPHSRHANCKGSPSTHILTIFLEHKEFGFANQTSVDAQNSDNQSVPFCITFVLSLNEVSESNFTKLCSTKSALVVNNSFPGPELHVHKGDTVFVNVHNQGDYGVTIHWHGVKMPRNPWSDGPENITQCPIPAKTNFTQEINFSVEEGTLWWHAHSDWSRATVHGAIIIHPKPYTSFPFTTPYKEKTIVLASWYTGSVMEVLEDSQESGMAPNVSDAFTINGEPGDLYDCSNGTTYKLNVEYGKTYLLRIVNAILNENTFFAIANHSLTLVGTDASYTKQFITDYIMITPGQTMDVLMTANQSGGGRYYMAAHAFSDSEVGIDETTATAIIQYSNSTSSTTPTFPSLLPIINDSDATTSFRAKLRSLNSAKHPISVPTNITRRIYMTISINILNCSTCNNGVRTAASANNVTFYTPDIDVLQAYYYNIPYVYNINGSFPEEPPYYFNFTGDVSDISVISDKGTKALMINYGDEVEIVFQGTNLIAAETHPMHLHGFSFFVVGTGFGNFDNETDPDTYNLVDPPEVNTMVLPKNGWTAIRFLADNPGVWFMHCHLERHTTWGMSTVVIVRDGNTTASTMRSPPAYMPPCNSTTS
ncbi:laccase-15-like [Rutidosis leptorrhynchoides]|uniref:laccase-15-like n=1 Tax=Rutidosis leptorrhynchoides TaxID=125765 RepID=UPI003A9A31FD